MTRPLVVLGATGSIGRQVLDVAQRLGLRIAAVVARRGSEALAVIAETHPNALVGVAAPTGSERERFEAYGDRVRFGPDAAIEFAARPDSIVVNGIVGAAGLRSSVAALEAGNRLALANKETLIAGGPVVLEALSRGGGEVIPVDSEHSAILQCLVGEMPETVRRLVLTASGGPFRGRSRDELENAKPADALHHPTWSMGSRVTIDSATLANKGFEVIEAHHLFGLPFAQIDVVVHPQSIVHSLVEFKDGSFKAQMGQPDMRIPIQYAITYPERLAGSTSADPSTWSLTFEAPDRAAFPALDIIIDAGRAGGSAPAVVNAADEIAVGAFLTGRLGFLGITRILEQTLLKVPGGKLTSVEDVVEVDGEARSVANSLIGGAC